MRLIKPLRLLAYAVISAVTLVVLSDLWITQQAKGRIFTQVKDAPIQDVGLVLGTSKYIGRKLNPYYTYRIEAADALFQQGKIQHLLLSGDNAHRSYNEPWTMKRDLLGTGVPEDNIHLDYAGFRTLDSIVRAKTVFDVDHFTIITQQFHCERALFLAKVNNIDAICFAVPGPSGAAGFKVRAREVFARVKALLDVYILHKEPKFTGPKEPLNEAKSN